MSGASEQFEVVVIGGGVAGLSAALMLGRSRRRTLIVDTERPRNRFAAQMHGVLGHEGVSPGELLARAQAEVHSYGVRRRTAEVTRLDDFDDRAEVHLSDGSAIRCDAIIVASGLIDDLPDIPCLSQRWGTSVLHCPYCHGWEVRDQRLGVLATSQMALHQVELVRQLSSSVTLFAGVLDGLEEGTLTRLASRGISVVNEPVVGLTGIEPQLDGVRTVSGQVVPVDALFTAATPVARDSMLAHLGLERSETPFGKFLAVDPTGKTSADRIWAAGNIVHPMANVPMSMSAGAVAGAAVNAALTTADFDRALRSAG